MMRINRCFGSGPTGRANFLAPWRRGSFALGILFLVAAPAFSQTVSDARLKLTTHVSGLSGPTGMQFLGDETNDFFVIEKDTGRVRHFLDGAISTALDLPVNFDSERGLLGIELDPDFADNGFAYLYYSRTSAAGDSNNGAQWVENRLSRFTWNGSTLTSEAPMLSFPADGAQANGPNHNGGPLVFGPDGNLYGVIGDMNRSRAEQNNTAQAGASATSGGIYRIQPNGFIPANNPFASSPTAFHKWFAYGVRNSFGMAFDPVTDRLWDTENGPDQYDEINLVNAGFNSGWTQIMGPDARDSQGVADLVTLPGAQYSDPEFSFLNPIGITSLAFLAESGLDGLHHDSVLVGGVNDKLYRLQLNTARDGFVPSAPALADLVADDVGETAPITFGTGFGVITDMRTGPDGAIYITSLTGDAIYRLTLATPWQNPLDPLDVDGNTEIQPLDALQVINDLNANGPHSLSPPGQGDGPPPFVDVDGNNFLTPLDALLIINRLNENSLNGLTLQSSAIARESNSVSVPEPPTAGLLALGLLALLRRAGCRRRRTEVSSR